MALARTAGRKGRPWERMCARVHDEDGRICLWCGHGEANAVNHNKPWSRFPKLRMTRSNLASVHGVEGCPHCPVREGGKRRNCNSEIGDLIPFVEVFPPGQGSRDW